MEDSPEMIERMRQREEGAISPRAAELALIRSVADDVVTRVMKEGEATHAVGEWRTRKDLIKHAKNHLFVYQLQLYGGNVEDLEHALTDIALELAKQKQ